jgi:hypothetical protein
MGPLPMPMPRKESMLALLSHYRLSLYSRVRLLQGLGKNQIKIDDVHFLDSSARRKEKRKVIFLLFYAS